MRNGTSEESYGDINRTDEWIAEPEKQQLSNAADTHPWSIRADRGDDGRRIDLVICRHLDDDRRASRTQVQAWIDGGRVTVNGARVRRTSQRATVGDSISVVLPELTARRVMEAEPDAAPPRVLYEDASLLAIDKPTGIVVHPAYRNPTATMMNALLWYAREWPDGQRPSLVGRLDKETSGVLLVAKNAQAHAALQRATADSGARKEYLAVVYGRVKRPRGTIDIALGTDPSDRRRMIPNATGAPSLTTFERLAHARAPRAGLALLRCTLGSGRRHQIRTHLAARSWPIVGDPVYGAPRWRDVADPRLADALHAFRRQALHAFRLSFVHPFTSERVEVVSPIPADMLSLIKAAELTGGVPPANAIDR